MTQSSKPICRIIDLAPPADDDSNEGSHEENIAIQIDAALREHGFFYVKNHGIPPELIKQQFDISHQIFNLPLPTKQSMPFNPTLDIGYLGSGLQAVGLTKQRHDDQEEEQDGGVGGRENSIDIKEQFMMTNNRLITETDSLGTDLHDSKIEQEGRRKPIIVGDSSNYSMGHPHDNIFDGSLNYVCNDVGVPNHLDVASQYASAVYRLNSRLQMYLATALKLTPEQRKQLGIGASSGNGVVVGDGTPATTASPSTVRGQSAALSSSSLSFMVLKQMKYQAALPSDPTEGRYGAGPHTDWGSFTVLATDSTPGLQVFLKDSTTTHEEEKPEKVGTSNDGTANKENGAVNGKWFDVPPIEGCLIINSGDQISCLTNGQYKSALHRVLILPEYVNKPRYSTACFCYFAMDSTFRPLPQFAKNEDDEGSCSSSSVSVIDPSQGRTTREYFHYKLHQSVSLQRLTDEVTKLSMEADRLLNLAIGSQSEEERIRLKRLRLVSDQDGGGRSNEQSLDLDDDDYDDDGYDGYSTEVEEQDDDDDDDDVGKEDHE